MITNSVHKPTTTEINEQKKERVKTKKTKINLVIKSPQIGSRLTEKYRNQVNSKTFSGHGC